MKTTFAKRAREFEDRLVDLIELACPQTARADCLLMLSWDLLKAGQRDDARAYTKLMKDIFVELQCEKHALLNRGKRKHARVCDRLLKTIKSDLLGRSP